MTSTKHWASTWVAALFTTSLLLNMVYAVENKAKPGDSTEVNPYMGAPVTLVKAPNGATANKKILDGIEKVTWLKPTIDQPVEGIWQFSGYGLAPITVIDTDEGLIAFDTGDSKHDGGILLKAILSLENSEYVGPLADRWWLPVLAAGHISFADHVHSQKGLQLAF